MNATKNVKEGKITTIIGAVVIAVALLLLFVPSHIELALWQIGAIGAVGILLLIAPDRLIGIIEKKAGE